MVVEGEEHVACSEAWVHASFDVPEPELIGDTVCGGDEAFWPASIRNVIELHGLNLTLCEPHLYLGLPKLKSGLWIKPGVVGVMWCQWVGVL